ncbi:hypothetical protein OAF13_02420 [Akkermansiaceae bacterium]|nr:hypothetical protein [Akkermansiaceae bacterium]
MSDNINEILEIKGETQTQVTATNLEQSAKAPEYQEPILSLLYKWAGWITLAAAIIALFSDMPYFLALLTSSVFLFGIAQVINLIGKIEFNTRKQ